MIHTQNFSSWWGRHSVALNQTDFWRIGPLHLWIQHSPHQWRLSWSQGRDWLDPTVRFVPRGEAAPASAGLQTVTCIFGQSDREELIFTPSLPDRPLVSRLTTPLHILPGEDVSLYTVLPLWLRVEMAEPTKTLHEIPIYRLSDTWFGPMSNSGELCYAGSASTFLDLREVPVRLHCAISTIQIRNMGFDSLRLDRLKLPLNRLSLFYSPRTGFWTDRVSFERGEDNEMATMKLSRQPPPDASPTQFVTGPRVGGSEPNLVVRAFSTFFRDRSPN